MRPLENADLNPERRIAIEMERSPCGAGQAGVGLANGVVVRVGDGLVVTPASLLHPASSTIVRALQAAQASAPTIRRGCDLGRTATASLRGPPNAPRMSCERAGLP